MIYDAIRCHTMPYDANIERYIYIYIYVVKKKSDIHNIYMRHVYKQMKKNDFR